MQQKIVDYKLCQRLAELGYDGESHCGWWVTNGLTDERQKAIYIYSQGQVGLNPRTGEPISNTSIKAYDCWDLLMWIRALHSKSKVTLYPQLAIGVDQFWLDMWHGKELDSDLDDQPQSALAKAIIKILEERQ